MFWLTLKVLAVLMLVLFAYVWYDKFWTLSQQARRLKAQGVVYTKKNENPLWTDTVEVMEFQKKNPYKQFCLDYVPYMNGLKDYPPITGICMFGFHFLVINSPDLVEDIYVKHNAYFTKQRMQKDLFAMISPNNLFFTDTHDKSFAPTRKALAQAFFKKQMEKLTGTIKEVALRQLKDYQLEIADAGGEKEMNLVEFMQSLQARIFVNITVGRGNSSKQCDFEADDGSISKISMFEAIKRTSMQTILRFFNAPLNLFVPYFNYHPVHAWDRRHARNSRRVRDLMQSIIDERRSGSSKAFNDDQTDLLQILLTDELFCKDDERIKDELISFFQAGMETIQVTSTNLIYHVTEQKDIQRKIMAEINPIMENCASDFNQRLGPDEVEEFTYLRRCFMESLRHHPPTGGTSTCKFSKAVKVGNVLFTPEDNFIVNFDAIQHNPKEWRDPNTFNPDRFDPESPMFKRPDGKPRNPLSFIAFNAGKRVCLGKSLAEIMINYTLPLIFYHFDFNFVTPDQANNKPDFFILTEKTPQMVLKIKNIRKIP